MKIDGKETGTSSVGRSLARNRMSQKQEPAGEGGDPQAEGGATSMHDHGGQEGTHEAIQQVASEHGPAEKAEVKPEGEGHTVTTHHGGHKHVSKGHPHVAHVAEHLTHASQSGMEEPSEPGAGQSETEGVNSLAAMGVGQPEA